MKSGKVDSYKSKTSCRKVSILTNVFAGNTAGWPAQQATNQELLVCEGRLAHRSNEKCDPVVELFLSKGIDHRFTRS